MVFTPRKQCYTIKNRAKKRKKRGESAFIQIKSITFATYDEVGGLNIAPHFVFK
jgi:hypothetical protein